MNFFETKILKIVTAQVEFFGTRSWKYSGAEEGVVKKLLMERILGGNSRPAVAAEAKWG
jgi:peroxiredoxin